MSNEVNPAYSAVFQSDIVTTYKAKEKAIKPLGLSIGRHLGEVSFHHHVLAPYKVINSTLETNRTHYLFGVHTNRIKLIQLYVVYIILNSWIPLRIIHTDLRIVIK